MLVAQKACDHITLQKLGHVQLLLLQPFLYFSKVCETNLLNIFEVLVVPVFWSSGGPLQTWDTRQTAYPAYP